MSFVRYAGLYALIILLAACGQDRLPPLSPEGRILAFGDSLTVGLGAQPEQSYPTILAQLSGRQVVSSGVSGEVSEDGLRRLPAVLDDVQPELMILLHGGNDILRNMNHDNTRRNLAAMIEIAHQRGIQVVLIGVPEKSLFSRSAPFYGELAEKYSLVFDGGVIAGMLRKSEYKSDSVHFNARGYSVLAEAFYGLLKDSGAL